MVDPLTQPNPLFRSSLIFLFVNAVCLLGRWGLSRPGGYHALRDVRAHLQQYLLGNETLPVFHDWFMTATSSLRRCGAADERVQTIACRLAEYKRRDWTEAQLRGRLREDVPWVDTYDFAYGRPEPGPTVDSATSPTVIRWVWGAS